MSDADTRRLPRRRAPRELVSIREFADAAHVHTDTVRRWAAQGVIPVYRLPSTGERPGPLRVDIADLARIVVREAPENVSPR
jgi:hypothetical protein